MNIFIWPFAFLFLLLPVFVYFTFPQVKEESKFYALKIPFFERIKACGASISYGKNSKRGRFFFIFAWILLTIASARPVWYPNASETPLNAKNIVLSLDVSESMAEEDFQIGTTFVDRLTAVKKVVTDFLNKREKDNIGFVLFGNAAYTYAPLAFDKKTLQTLLDEIGIGIAGNMTALGDGLALGVQTALKVPAKSQIVILLSDGYANAGSISVKQAIDIAKRNNIKVYTIGIGAKEQTQNFYGMKVAVPTTLDEKTLQKIATETGGQYFLAETTQNLQDIYKIIDELEQDSTSNQYLRPRKELFYIPLFLGLLFLLIGFIWRGQL